VDAAPIADAAVPTFCDDVLPTPTICIDFDRGPLKDQWDNRNRTPDIGASGGGAIEPSEGRSLPTAASLRIPALVDSSAKASAILVRSLHGLPADGFTATFAVRIDVEQFPPGVGLVPIAQLQLGNEILQLVRNANGMYLATSSSLLHVNGTLAAGSWNTLQFQVRRGVGGGDGGDGGNARSVARFSINVFNTTFIELPPSVDSVTDAKLILGPITQGPLFPFSMRVDDVVVHYSTVL
jgi:hypothetical protein